MRLQHLLHFMPLWATFISSFHLKVWEFLCVGYEIDGRVLPKPLVTWLLSYRPKQHTATPLGEFE